MAKIRAHDAGVIFGQAAQQLVLKIISTGRDRAAVTLLKGAAAGSLCAGAAVAAGLVCESGAV